MSNPVSYGYCTVDDVVNAFPAFQRDQEGSIPDTVIQGWIADRKAAIRSAFITRGIDPDEVVFSGALMTVAVGAGGTGYTVGDVLTIVQLNAGGGSVVVKTLAGSSVATVAIQTTGNAYLVTNGLVATGGTGTGCTINVTAVISDQQNFLKALNRDGAMADLGDAMATSVTLQPGEVSLMGARRKSYLNTLKEITESKHDKLFQGLARTWDVNPLFQGTAGAETSMFDTAQTLGENRFFSKNDIF